MAKTATEAKEKYKKNQTDIDKQIVILKETLKAHADKFKKDDSNFGFVGDLGYIKSILIELNGFMKITKSK